MTAKMIDDIPMASAAGLIAELAVAAAAPSLVMIPTKGLGAGLPDEVPVLFDRANQKVIDLQTTIAAARQEPARRKGIARVDTLDSFIDLIDRHKDGSSAIFGATTWPEPKLTTVLNYNEAAAPHWNDHRIIYAFPLTEEFKAWINGNKTPMDQAEFAAFLEEHAAELAAPFDGEVSEYERLFKERFATPADLIALARHLEVFVGASVKQGVRLQTGERTVEFKEEHLNGKGEKVDISRHLHGVGAGLPVWRCDPHPGAASLPDLGRQNLLVLPALSLGILAPHRGASGAEACGPRDRPADLRRPARSRLKPLARPRQIETVLMKIALPRTALLAALGHIKAVVDRRNTIPILSNVLLVATSDGLTLTATDLDIEIRTKIAGTPEQEGAATVQAALLADIVRKLPDKATVTLALAADGKTVRVEAGRTRMDLLALSALDFPNITASQFPYSFTLSPSTLTKIIAKTEFAISTEETRYYLCGIYLHVRDGNLVAVATDGHRLARITLPLPQEGLDFPGIIVPSKTVARLRELAKSFEADLTIEISERQIRVSVADTVLTSKLVEGTFPDYQRVIPQNNSLLLTVERAALASAVDRVSTVSAERGRAVKFNAEDGALRLTVVNADAGTGEETLDVDYAAEPIEIGFNAKYVGDALGIHDGEKVCVAFDLPGSPAVVTNPADDQVLIVLMPMRV
jgi:DNA polymerase-3 subunit beta